MTLDPIERRTVRPAAQATRLCWFCLVQWLRRAQRLDVGFDLAQEYAMALGLYKGEAG
jgi:hypothetical protein